MSITLQLNQSDVFPCCRQPESTLLRPMFTAILYCNLIKLRFIQIRLRFNQYYLNIYDTRVQSFWPTSIASVSFEMESTEIFLRKLIYAADVIPSKSKNSDVYVARSFVRKYAVTDCWNWLLRHKVTAPRICHRFSMAMKWAINVSLRGLLCNRNKVTPEPVNLLYQLNPANVHITWS